MSDDTVTIGSGSAFAGSSPELAEDMVTSADIEYLAADRLAERTLAHAVLERNENPDKGYNPQLERWFETVLPHCVDQGIPIIGNFGAANPLAAGEKVLKVAADLGIDDLQVATITGDDVLDDLPQIKSDLLNLDTGEPIDLKALEESLISANAYLGARPIVEALDQGADVVVGGRIADAALFLGPLVHEFGWDWTDYDKLAHGAVVGHLLECGARATGGTLAYPGYTKVPGYDQRLGAPLAEVGPSGEAVLSKPSDTGGIVSELGLSTQICWEIHDPSAYMTPDVAVDLTGVELEQLDDDHVRMSGAAGNPRPDELKVVIGSDGGYIAEAMKIWAGPDAAEKARFTKQTKARWVLEAFDEDIIDSRVDLIGLDAVFGEAAPEPEADPYEVGIRVAAKFEDEGTAETFRDEIKPELSRGAVGVGGSGAVRAHVRRFLKYHPTLIPRDVVEPEVQLKEIQKMEA